MFNPGRAEEIIEWLKEYEYASFQHVLFHLMWYMGARVGGIKALDLVDFHETSPDGPYLDFVHRPETGTPLKNDWKSERMPPIGDGLRDLLADYIENTRPNVTDDHGREPLVATKYGRPAHSTIQRTVYALTQPCQFGECPHDRDPDTCEATGDYNAASKCPSSRSPHALRRGRATMSLNDVVEPIPDRMLVILEPSEEGRWLEEDDPDELRDMLDPFPSDLTDAYEISTKVNNTDNDSPEVIEPLGHDQSGLGKFS